MHGLALVRIGAAVCFEPLPKPNAEYFHSAAVFSGKVVSERDDTGQGELNGWYYRVRVSRRFRGPATRFVTVYSSNDSARLQLEVGKEYLIFAKRLPGERFLFIGSCGNTGLLEESSADLQELSQIGRLAHSGWIEGHIRSYVRDAEADGLTITVRGRRRTYSAVVESDGWFHVKVPPGRYSVVGIKSDSFYVNDFDLSYDDPYNFVVHAGGTAEIELVLRPK